MDLPGLEDDADDAKDYYDSLIQERKDLQREIREAISPSETDRLKLELRTLNADILDAYLDQRNADGAVNKQNQKIKNAKTRMDAADKRIKDVRKKIDRLKQQKQDKEDNLQRLRDNYESSSLCTPWECCNRLFVLLWV